MHIAVVGPETSWPAQGTTSIRDIRDGPSTTLMCVETHGHRIRWTQPDDLHFDELDFAINSSSGRGITSSNDGGANVLCGDGTVRFVSENVKPKTIRDLLTIAGGEPVQASDF
jgi:hypothetical protein